MKSIATVIALIALALAAGCATSTKSAFPPSPVMPGVANSIELSADVNGNNRVKFTVNHLAPPNTLVPAKAFYVVWARSADGRSIPLGRLWIGDTRSGSFAATVPFLEFQLIVTAEDDVVPEKPNEPFVLASDLLKAQPRQ